MSDSALLELSGQDDTGRPTFRVAADDSGELVLCSPAGALPDGTRELDTEERIQLADLAGDRPALVVESLDGRYVVLIDRGVDLERHVPLGPADAELVAGRGARARFGRRDDDVLLLTPWAEEDEVVLFNPDAEDFAEVPLVAVDADGSVIVDRGTIPDGMLPAVQAELERLDAEPGDSYGVLFNPFGECLCVPEGTALPPHEDVRRQALLTTAGLLNGADTLAEAAQRLRGLADRLTDADSAGWRLVQPVVDDLAFVEGPAAGAAG